MKGLKSLMAGLVTVFGVSGCSAGSVQTLPLKVLFDVSKVGYVYETDIYVKKPFFGATVGNIYVHDSLFNYVNNEINSDMYYKHRQTWGNIKCKITIKPIKNVTAPTEYSFFTIKSGFIPGDYHEYKSNKVETMEFVLDQSKVELFSYFFQDKGYYHIKVENLNAIKLPQDKKAILSIILPTKI